jgi:hypothetical protein
MLSLRKAAYEQEVWNLGGLPTRNTHLQSIKFHKPQKATYLGSDDIPLQISPESSVSTR